MPINPVWSNAEQTILQLNYEEPISGWAEFDSAIDEAYRMVREVQHPVWLIYNTGDFSIPRGYAIPHIQRAMKLGPPNLRGVVTVSRNSFARNLVGAVARLVTLRNVGNLGRRVTMVSSLEEALKIIAARQKSDPNAVP
jgi:hypothetical protein